MDGERLAAAFIANSALTPGDHTALAAELGELVARAHAEAPNVAIDPVAFVAYVAERAMLDGDGCALLRPLHAGALWIACGCVRGEPSALAAFEAHYADEIHDALARNFDRGLAEDAELRLRERLFLVADDDMPRLASYAGRGDLGAWLRAAAVRTAIDLMRSRREIAVADPGAVAEATAASDPLLAELKERYREEFRVAFREAMATLGDRERTLLRYTYVEDLTIDEIAGLYRVHRATAARWLAAIREALFDATRARLMQRLELRGSEVDSVLRLIDSHLEASVRGVLRP